MRRPERHVHLLQQDAPLSIPTEGDLSRCLEGLLKQAMQGALKKPLFELPKEFAKVRAAIQKDQLAGALKELDVLAKAPSPSPEVDPLKASVLAMVEGRLAAASAAAAAGDFATAKDGYERLAKGAAGLPAEKSAKDALAEMAKNPEAQKGLKAQKALEAILAMPAKKSKDVEARNAALKDFAKRNQGTFAASKAEAALAAPVKGGG